MLPSSATPDGTGSSTLRRYGPIVGIVVVLAIIAAVVVANRGDDKKATATSSSSSSTSTKNPASTTGAVTFNDAKQAGRTDLTFPDGCDKTLGRVAIPSTYPVDCFANQPAVTDPNTQGVTNDSITVVVYIPPDDDAILKLITAPIQNNDTGAQRQETFARYNDLYAAFYQTYGRKVQLKFLQGSGNSIDAVAARADAVKAAEELHAFAVFGGPAITDAWTQELNARNVLCIGCSVIDKPQPNVFSIGEGNEQGQIHMTEYATKRLKGKPAQFAGDPAMKTQNRVFGEAYEATNATPAAAHAADLKSKFEAAGMKLDTQVAYTLGTVQEAATTVISKLKSGGVTSVILETDPIGPKTFTEEATRQNYFPEWILGPAALIDVTAFGRTYDQQQWTHAFGISALNARIDPQKSDAFNLYRWFTGQDPAAKDTAGVLWPDVALFYAALQAAGPKLNRDTFRAGLFAGTPPSGHLTTVTISYGNHGFWPTIPDDYWGIDDFTEVWWDTSATGPDEIRRQGTGMYEYSEGGKRFLPGQWTNDTKAFDKNGALTIYTTSPPGEQAQDYPSPAGGSSSSSSSAN